MIETTGLIKKVSQDGVVADTSATVEDHLNGSLSRPQHNIQKASAEIQNLSDAIHDLDTGSKSWGIFEKEQGWKSWFSPLVECVRPRARVFVSETDDTAGRCANRLTSARNALDAAQHIYKGTTRT